MNKIIAIAVPTLTFGKPNAVPLYFDHLHPVVQDISNSELDNIYFMNAGKIINHLLGIIEMTFNHFNIPVECAINQEIKSFLEIHIDKHDEVGFFAANLYALLGDVLNNGFDALAIRCVEGTKYGPQEKPYLRSLVKCKTNKVTIKIFDNGIGNIDITALQKRELRTGRRGLLYGGGDLGAETATMIKQNLFEISGKQPQQKLIRRKNGSVFELTFYMPTSRFSGQKVNIMQLDPQNNPDVHAMNQLENTQGDLSFLDS